MKLFPLGLRWMLSVFLIVHVAGAAAAPELAPEMRAALTEFTAVQELDPALLGMLDEQRQTLASNVIEGLHSGFNKNKNLSEARRERAHALTDELASKIRADVDVALRTVNLRAMMLGAFETIYPAAFDAAEIRQLAAHEGSSAYKKLAPLAAMARTEASRTGQDPRAVFENLASKKLSTEESLQLSAFQASALGQKYLAARPVLRPALNDAMRMQFLLGMLDVALVLKPTMEALSARLEAD